MTALLLAALCIGLVFVAMAQPLLPKKHPKISPTSNSALCYKCHQSAQMPSLEQAGFCEACHFNAHYETTADIESPRLGPRARHPVPPDWKSALCFTCHKPHKTKIAKHPVLTTQPSSSFCMPCHITQNKPQGRAPKSATEITGEERVGDFCMPCHNMALKSAHPAVPEGVESRFCFMCHKTIP